MSERDAIRRLEKTAQSLGLVVPLDGPAGLPIEIEDDQGRHEATAPGAAGAAGALTGALTDAVARSVGYAGRGGQIEGEIDVQHQSACGSTTTAKLCFKFTRGS